ncbi:hypothetical protein MMC18_004660 [Xylographa bjoerkii]|nr:hypothetical protein [Xylographa bjoerkii]
MSGSAALEYGFPSTHSTNAVSVAVYALFTLNHASSTVSPTTKLLLEILSYTYAISIIIGRVYCGMHGLFDVVVGSLLGAALSILEFLYVNDFDNFIHEGSFKAISIVVLIICVLVRVHPEPADDCPCFDDSVAFAGVLCGIEIGNWHYAQSPLSWDFPVPATVPFHLEDLGWPKTIIRTCIGVICIVAWRSVMKLVLLKALPPIFRIVERLGLSLPRRFFKQASEYDNVPSHLKTDNVMPSVSEFPNLYSSIRHPRRSRSISIGPQSEADAYEALAFRHRKRRESISSIGGTSISWDSYVKRNGATKDSFEYAKASSQTTGTPSAILSTQERLGVDIPGLKNWSSTDVFTPSTPIDTAGNVNGLARTPSQMRRQDEKEEKEIFSKLAKPRVRYDVEVITKMIVYSGIAWLAVEGNPILFHYLGLGLDRAPN